MVLLNCRNHPTLFWITKPQAIYFSVQGTFRYSGARDIFFQSPCAECACDSSDLRVCERISDIDLLDIIDGHSDKHACAIIDANAELPIKAANQSRKLSG